MRISKFLTAGVIAAALTSCSDPEKEANIVFVDAANQIQEASSLDTLTKYNAYSQARAKLDTLNSEEFKGTQASLKVASQEKIGGLTSSELNDELAKLKASNAVCGTIRSHDCLSDIVTAAVQELIEKRDNTALKSITRLVGRLELAGNKPEAEAVITQLGKAIGEPDLVRKAKAEYPQLLGETIADFSSAYTDDEMLTLYKRALSLEEVKSAENSSKRLQEELLRTINLENKPDLYLFLVENEAEIEQRQKLADRALGSVWPRFGGKKPPLDVSLRIAGHLSADKRVERLAQIASAGKEEADEVFMFITEENERKAVEEKMFSMGMWDWQPAERLDVLKRMPAEALRESPYVVISTAVVNRDRKDDLIAALDAIGSVQPSDKSVMLLYPEVRAYIEGMGDLSDLVGRISKETSSSTSGDGRKLCELAPQLIAQAGKSELLPSLADACLPIYKLDGDSIATAAALVRDLAQAAKYAKEDDISAALLKTKELRSIQSDPSGIVASLLYGNKQQIALDVARNSRDGGDTSLSPVYSQLLRKAISVEGGDPASIWSDIKSKNVRFEHSWIVPTENLTEQGGEFLDRIIAEDADLVARQVVETSKRWDHLFRNDFTLLSKDRLVALSRNVRDPELKAAVLDTLAMRLRKNDNVEIVDAAWNLQDDKSGAAMRITAIQLGSVLGETEKSQ